MQDFPTDREEDRLFGDDLPDGYNNAWLGFRSDQREWDYLEGYLRGARYLVDQVVDQGKDQDVLVYPIVFLFRHHVELSLKLLILRSANLLGSELSGRQLKKLERHNLTPLWNELKPMLAALDADYPSTYADEIRRVDSQLSQLAEVDSGSTVFRYAREKNGVATIPTEMRQFNIRHFAEMMNKLAEHLELIHAGTLGLAQERDGGP